MAHTLMVCIKSDNSDNSMTRTCPRSYSGRAPHLACTSSESSAHGERSMNHFQRAFSVVSYKAFCHGRRMLPKRLRRVGS